MADYVSEEDISAFGHEFDSLVGTSAISLLITAASRLFDNLCEVKEDYFAIAGDTATARTFYGDGTAYLKVDPFVPTPTPVITIPGDEYEIATTDWAIKDDQILWLDRLAGNRYWPYDGVNRYTGWHESVPVSVTAKWGFTAVPADVQMAVIHLAWHLRRTADPAFAQISGVEGKAATLELPTIAQNVIDKYRAKYSQNFIFA